MSEWLAANIGTIMISLLLAVIVGAIIASMIRDRKKGKTSCGCGCGHCAMSCHCHADKSA